MSQALLQIGIVIFGLAWVTLIAFAVFKAFGEKTKKSKLAERAAGLKWISLELKIPKENLKTHQAMEQVFASLHGISGDDSLAVEIVGFSHGIHFFIRLPEQYRNLVEAAIFSQYPDAEISVTDDYVGRLGVDLPNETYDFSGGELTLWKDSSYPIRTYPSFERGGKPEDEHMDPIATIAEVMSKLREDEMILLQIVLKPLSNSAFEKWKKQVYGVLDELLGRKPKEKKVSPIGKVVGTAGEFAKNLVLAPVQAPTWDGKEEKKDEKPQGKQFSYGENEIIKAVENKFSKFCFESGVRVMYLDRRDSFTKENIASVIGALRQFGAPNLNTFRLDDPKLTFIEKNFNKEQTELGNKRKFFKDYCERSIPKKPMILCTEELATLYHPPLSSVGAEKLLRLTMKKGGPPPDLPVINE